MNKLSEELKKIIEQQEQKIKNIIEKQEQQQIKEEQKRAKKEEKYKTNPMVLANKIMKKHYFITPTDTTEILYYKNGIYITGSEKIIEQELIKLIDKEHTRYKKAEVIDIIKIKSYTEREQINPEHLLFLKNGVYNINTKKLVAHTPKLYGTRKLNVEYKPTAKAKKALKFIHEILDEKSIKLVQQFFGYCLLSSSKHEKAMIFLGTGENGKSLLIKLLEKMLNKENCLSIPIQELINDKFVRHNLNGKLINACPDLPADQLKSTGVLKMLISGDKLSCQVKFKEPYDISNTCKIIFSANQIPETPDKTPAFFRRWLILKFNKVFNDKLGNKNPDLYKEITTQNELNGLFNWSLQGLNELENNKKFTNAQTIEEVKNIWERNSESLSAFVFEEIEFDETSNGIEKNHFYEEYIKFCNENELPILSRKAIAQKLPLLISTSEWRPSENINPQRKRFWNNIIWKHPEKHLKETETTETLEEVDISKIWNQN